LLLPLTHNFGNMLQQLVTGSDRSSILRYWQWQGIDGKQAIS